MLLVLTGKAVLCWGNLRPSLNAISSESFSDSRSQSWDLALPSTGSVLSPITALSTLYCPSPYWMSENILFILVKPVLS